MHYDQFNVGRQESKSPGIAEGAHQKALETAKNLRQFGLSIENIAQATGLSQEEVEKLNS